MTGCVYVIPYVFFVSRWHRCSLEQCCSSCSGMFKISLKRKNNKNCIGTFLRHSAQYSQYTCKRKKNSFYPTAYHWTLTFCLKYNQQKMDRTNLKSILVKFLSSGTVTKQYSLPTGLLEPCASLCVHLSTTLATPLLLILLGLYSLTSWALIWD